MKILTKEILKKIDTFDSTCDLTINQQTVYLKLFGGSSFSWYITALNPYTLEAFGYVNLGDVENAELGYIDLNELLHLRFPPLNLPIERDMYFKPMSLKTVIDLIQSGKHV